MSPTNNILIEIQFVENMIFFHLNVAADRVSPSRSPSLQISSADNELHTGRAWLVRIPWI